MRYFILYLVTAVILLGADFLWIGVIAKKFYKEKLDFVFSGSFNMIPAFIFYGAYVVGLLYFAVLPASGVGEMKTALLNGAFLGFLCYATYNLTNMATIREWPLSVAVVDILWGTAVSAGVSVVSFYVATGLLDF